jgi:molybdate transport system permease protein
MTTVIVTHDPAEAALLADDILLVADGHLLQAGPQAEVFTRPADPHAARLLGATNLHHGRIVAPGVLHTAGIDLDIGRRDHPPHAAVVWSIPPEHVELSETGGYPADVLDRIAMPGHDELTLLLPGALELTARTRPDASHALGSTCRVQLAAPAISTWTVGDAAEADAVDGVVAAGPSSA